MTLRHPMVDAQLHEARGTLDPVDVSQLNVTLINLALANLPGFHHQALFVILLRFGAGT